MKHLWDYDEKVLKKSRRGRILLLERMINYGVYPKSHERINLSAIKKHWDELQIDKDRKRFLHYLIWEK